MTHWRHMMDDDYLHAADLMGKEHVVVIDRVTQGQFPDYEDPKSKKRKPVLWFRGKRKPLGINSTIARAITKLAGTNQVEKWVGVAITIYPTTTRAFGEEWECIRVKGKKPDARNASTSDLDAAGPPQGSPPGDPPPLTDDEKREIERLEREVNP